MTVPRYTAVPEGRRITILEDGHELCIVYVTADKVSTDPESWQAIADQKVDRIIDALELMDQLRAATR